MFDNKILTQAFYNTYQEKTQTNLERLLDRLQLLYEALPIISAIFKNFTELELLFANQQLIWRILTDQRIENQPESYVLALKKYLGLVTKTFHQIVTFQDETRHIFGRKFYFKKRPLTERLITIGNLVCGYLIIRDKLDLCRKYLKETSQQIKKQHLLDLYDHWYPQQLNQ